MHYRQSVLHVQSFSVLEALTLSESRSTSVNHSEGNFMAISLRNDICCALRENGKVRKYALSLNKYEIEEFSADVERSPTATRTQSR